MPDTDTIAAISTPPGRGGIGVARLAGPDAVAIATRLVRLTQPLEHARARFTRVLDPRRAQNPEAPEAPTLDEAVITAFLAPHSYTGDDVVEISAHGSPVVLNAILTAALSYGARLAEPGEFTRRAFLAGRLDLTQAEAVHDLISAQTLEQARAAAQQLGGALSRRLAPAKEQLLHLITLLEAGMDFASGELDDVDVVPPAQIAAEIAAAHSALEELARSFRAGALLRSGASLALVGRPNAGKSSLFNRLLQRPRAIVTPVPGTTRDTVEESWSLAGIPVRLVDTAGLRVAAESPADEAERQGIQRSREALADADLVLLVHDATLPFTREEQSMIDDLKGRPHLLLRNKIDLIATPAATTPDGETPHTLADAKAHAPADEDAHPSGGETAHASHRATAQAPDAENAHMLDQENDDGLDGENDDELPDEDAHPLAVSALTGEGVQELREAILRKLNAGGGLAESGALNNRRQQEHVLAAISALEAAREANTAHLPHELLLLDLHQALQALDALTGQTTADDILARIFSTFCIGK